MPPGTFAPSLSSAASSGADGRQANGSFYGGGINFGNQGPDYTMLGLALLAVAGFLVWKR